ncbi:EF-hand domain-containing protein [Bryobacter aggregatus]|uniref:EF-hand domain-containing protein n=1 Tax=Bryobacter aggregatus TaxID=360054 RepID=UPI00068E295A|nr:EF-hand domain-containing protein [Bryobacter aggregatus]
MWCGLLPLLASAQEGRPPQSFIRNHYILSKLDANQDGVITLDELSQARKVLLRFDLDEDGILSAEELKAPIPLDLGVDELVQGLLAHDKNGDGILTKDELPERMQGLLVRGDLNHDGKLDKSELRKLAISIKFPDGRPAPANAPAGPMRVDPVVAALDTDKDGKLSAAELTAAPESLRVLDKNGDGQIVDSEVRPAPRTPPGTPAERAARMFNELDADKDGKLSKAELPPQMQDRFDLLDTNQDGFISKEELATMLASQPGPRH